MRYILSLDCGYIFGGSLAAYCAEMGQDTYVTKAEVSYGTISYS